MRNFDVEKKGFTIIEVSLVLAIAGLIFMMVFVALPSLRRQQRDTDRREDMISFLDNVKSYQKNNRGALPGGSNIEKTTVNYNSDVANTANVDDSSWAGFYKGYLGENFIDPAGEHYNLQVIKCGQSTVGNNCEHQILNDLAEAYFPNDYKMIVVLQSSCSGEKAVATSSPRKLSVLYRLEGAGIYCNNI